MPKKQDEHLKNLEADAKVLALSQIIKTEEAREILNLQRRLIEVLLYGEPRTEKIKRNHD